VPFGQWQAQDKALAWDAAAKKWTLNYTGGKPGDWLKEPDGLEPRFGYFPSLDKPRLLVLRTPDAFTGWEARLSKPPLKEALRQWEGPPPFPKAGLSLAAPALDEGAYMLAVTLVAKDGQRREIQRTFERKRFPWENNPAGRERIVIPPFTPLQVDEAQRTVSCVLRQHELGNGGLWHQVTSQGRPLLAAPMRLEIEAAGKTTLVQEGELNSVPDVANAP
jgi:hypothetical protein